MKRLIGVLVVTAAAVVPLGTFDIRAQSNAPKPAAPSTEWPTYGHDPGGMRFSPLTQITPANVGQLQVAWVYHMRPPAPPAPAARRRRVPPRRRDADADAAVRASPRAKTTPLVVNGVMYIATPYGRVVALDPTTGKEVWAFQLPSGNPSTRGVEYWPGDAQTPPQIVFGIERRQALLARREDRQAQRQRSATSGIVDLNTPEILQGLPGQQRPELAADRVQEPRHHRRHARRRIRRKGPAGDVRAWDMHTGKLVWTFHSIPRAGEKFNDTWAGDSWKNRSGVNVWGFITVDAQRGIVYMPFGAPSVDQYGGDRAGDNLFGTSLVAADANTGKYLWHFQVVHHDIWDADLSARAGAHRREAGRQDDSRRGGDQQGRAAVPARPRDRQADLRRRGASGAAERGAARARVEDAAVPAQAAAARAHDDDARRTSRPSRPSSKRRAGS